MSSSSSASPVLVPNPADADAFLRLQMLEQQMHLLSAAQQAPAPVLPRPVLPKAPPMVTFTGQVGINGFEVDAWLREVHKQFTHYGPAAFPDHAARIKYAVQWLNGAALDWWENEIKSAPSCNIWEEFEQRIRDRYRPHMPAELARQRLRQLQQKGHVSSYCNHFLQLVSRIPDKSESDKIFEFKQGLDRAFAVKVAEAKPKTLQEAIDVAVQAAPYITTIGRTGFQQQGRGVSSFVPSVQRFSSPSSSVPMDINSVEFGSVEDVDREQQSGSVGHDPHTVVMQAMLNKMEALEHRLHAMWQPSARASNSKSRADRIPGLSAEDVARLRAEGRCFRCKKTGHMKNECPNSASVRLNA
jgi:hypothetical protein